MGLFGRDEDEEEHETQEVDPPEDGSGEDTPQASDGADDLEEAPTEDPDSGASSDASNDIDVEEALKELSARMAMLSSNLEGVKESRGELEDKLGTVEERMSRLGSLAEAVSSEYNPFISENAPTEPSWTPEPEAAEEPGPPPASDPSSGDDETSTQDRTEEAQAPEPSTQGQEDPPEVHSNGSGDDPEATAEMTDPPEDEHPEETSSAPETIPRTDPERLETAQAEPIEDVAPEEADTGTNPLAASPGPRPSGELEENLLMLEWVGTMLDRVGRAGLMDLLDYYQNLGWLDRQTKDRVTRVAVGVEAPDRVGEGHWRGDVELHRRSLVAIQRLQGNEVPAAHIDEVQLDLQRLFEG